MKRFQSRLKRLETSHDRTRTEHNTKLAPKNNKRKANALNNDGEDISDDESVLLSRVLSSLADPVEEHANKSTNDTDNLLSDIAQELIDQEPTGTAVNKHLVAMLNKRWVEKLPDKKLAEKLDSIQRQTELL